MHTWIKYYQWNPHRRIIENGEKNIVRRQKCLNFWILDTVIKISRCYEFFGLLFSLMLFALLLSQLNLFFSSNLNWWLFCLILFYSTFLYYFLDQNNLTKRIGKHVNLTSFEFDFIECSLLTFTYWIFKIFPTLLKMFWFHRFALFTLTHSHTSIFENDDVYFLIAKIQGFSFLSVESLTVFVIKYLISITLWLTFVYIWFPYKYFSLCYFIDKDCISLIWIEMICNQCRKEWVWHVWEVALHHTSELFCLSFDSLLLLIRK